MEITLKTAVAVIGMMMLGLGFMSMFAPGKMLKNFSVEPIGAAGLNTIRGVIGGLFIGCLVVLGIGLATGQTLWFLPVGILLAAVAFGRLVGAAFDGLEKSIIPPLVLEFVMIGILFAAHFHGIQH